LSGADRAVSGLGIVMRSSSDWVKDGERWIRSQTQKTSGLNPSHNSTLKLIFKGVATTIITKLEDEPLRKDYERLLTQGTSPISPSSRSLEKSQQQCCRCGNTRRHTTQNGIGKSSRSAEWPVACDGSESSAEQSRRR
jgi:hypothetical protein